MMFKRLFRVSVTMFLLAAASFAHGADDDAASDSDKPTASKAAKTHAVKIEPIKQVIEVSGVFEATSQDPVSIRLLSWSSLKVLEAVPHGTVVKEGQPLVRFDFEPIDEAIHELEMSLELNEITLKQSESDLDLLQKTSPMDHAQAKRAKEQSEQDFARYVTIDRPMSEKRAEYSVKSSEDYLDYSREELNQLEKMYEADDLTEESEEIVLRRQRDTVERAEFSLEQSKTSRNESLEITLPRREESMREAARRGIIDLERASIKLPAAIKRAELELEKARHEREKSEEKLRRLRRDRQAMEIKAPGSGVVYYGKSSRGKWAGVTAMEAKLRLGGSVTSNEVFMTIVKARSLQVRGVVSEKNLGDLRLGARGVVLPAGFSDESFPGRLSSVNLAPYSEGKFDAVISVEGRNLSERIQPGMVCSVKFLAYDNPRALTVPASAVFYDDLAEQKPYVYLAADDDGEPEKRSIDGKKIGDKFEVARGLQKGDQVLKSKPEEKP